MPGAARPIIAEAPLALTATPWPDYALLDSGGGRKLERYGGVTVVRPESQCLWAPALDEAAWAEDWDTRTMAASAKVAPIPRRVESVSRGCRTCAMGFLFSRIGLGPNFSDEPRPRFERNQSGAWTAIPAS